MKIQFVFITCMATMCLIGCTSTPPENANTSPTQQPVQVISVTGADTETNNF